MCESIYRKDINFTIWSVVQCSVTHNNTRHYDKSDRKQIYFNWQICILLQRNCELCDWLRRSNQLHAQNQYVCICTVWYVYQTEQENIQIDFFSFYFTYSSNGIYCTWKWNERTRYKRTIRNNASKVKPFIWTVGVIFRSAQCTQCPIVIKYIDDTLTSI